MKYYKLLEAVSTDIFKPKSEEDVKEDQSKYAEKVFNEFKEDMEQSSYIELNYDGTVESCGDIELTVDNYNFINDDETFDLSLLKLKNAFPVGALVLDERITFKGFDSLPEIIGGDLNLHSCKNITSLKGFPKVVDSGDIILSYTDITSLEGCPMFKDDINGFQGSLLIDSTDIIDFKGCPKYIPNDLNCERCRKITSLEGFPTHIGGDVNLYQTNFDDDIEEKIREICDVKGNIYIS